MAAGKPVCDCDLPNTCLCKVDVKSNIKDAPTYSCYPNHPLPTIFAHDSDCNGAKVNVTMISKGCIGGYDEVCPSVRVFDVEEGTTIGSSRDGTYLLRYAQFEGEWKGSAKANPANIVALLMMAIMPDVKKLQPHYYRIQMRECGGQPPVETTGYAAEGAGRHLLSDSLIAVYPRYKATLTGKVEISSQGEQQYSDAERHALFYKASPNNYEEYGWKKYTHKYGVASALTFNGSLSGAWGGMTLDANSDKLKKEFVRYKKQFTLLDTAEQTLNIVGKLFTSGTSRYPYPIFSCEFISPCVAVKAETELDFSKKEQQPYLKGSVSLGFEPLIGVKFTIDLIQAFAMAYGIDRFVAEMRAALAAGEETIQKGGNGAYFGAELKLVVEGKLDVKLAFSLNEERKISYEVDDTLEGTLAISAGGNLRTGAKIGFVNGYFAMGGQATATGCFGLLTKPEAVYLVFYHKGVEVSYWWDWGYGEGAKLEEKKEKSVEKNPKGVITGRTTSQIVAPQAAKTPEEAKLLRKWLILAPVKKEQSRWRIALSGQGKELEPDNRSLEEDLKPFIENGWLV
ncbi:hypothetical protein [Serratia microhaemolytica]|uniref:hypothetical protein n=1 Tax=Serratia microhaemolytica TaxID=2675110 RepID=UPI000FDD4FB3|nr:hypothetical protein [Serratia microhaemolytica]